MTSECAGSLVQCIGSGLHNDMLSTHTGRYINLLTRIPNNPSRGGAFASPLDKHLCDVIEAIIINLEHIDRLESLSLTVGHDATTHMTAATIMLYRALNNHTARVPFVMPMLPVKSTNDQHRVSIRAELSSGKTNPSLVSTHMQGILPRDICELVGGYVGHDFIDGYIDIYLHNRVLNAPDIPKYMSDKSHIYMFRSATHKIGRMISDVDLPVVAGPLMCQVVWGFHDGVNFIPILGSGYLRVNGVIHTELSHYMSHTVDKVAHGINIPTAPIYTITFDNPSDVHRKKYTSTINTARCRDIYLNLSIEPQDRDITLYMYTHSINQFAFTRSCGGYGLRHAA